MEPPRSSRGAEPAAAALRHLRGVEKQLHNEGLVFNKETVQHLEDAIKAIKELEEERKCTIELLEEETIKNCNLRVRIKGLPEIVMKEFEELVAAAHRFRFDKLSEIEVSINESITAIEATYSKQELSEEQNTTLCEEQAELWIKHQEVIELVNQQMAEKHAVNIEINELHNLKKQEEEEIVMEKNAIEELKIIMAHEATEFREKKNTLDEQIADLQRELEAKRRENSAKRDEYLELASELKDLQEKIEDYTKSNMALRDELAELFKQIRKQINEFEEKKARKEELLKKKADLQTRLMTKEGGFDEEREELLRQLKDIEEKLEVARQCYEKLKKENDLLSTQLQAFLDEEERSCGERDRLAEEFEHLSNMLTEKLDHLAKRLVETKTIEDELDRLQEILDVSQNTYTRELSHLEDTLKKENDRREMLQDQLANITAQYQKMIADHNELLETSKQKSDAYKKRLSELTAQNEQLKKEIKASEEILKALLDKLHKKEAQYKKRDASLLAEIKKLEEEYNATKILLQEKEEELKVNLPLSQELKTELEETTTSYNNQNELCAELLEEERMLKKSIDRSLKEISKLNRQKTNAKNELKKNRELAFDQLQRFGHSLKFLERDNYEVNRKLYVLNAENARLRAGIAFLKEDVSTIEYEAKVYQSERQQIHKDRKALYDLFIKKWIRDEHLQKMFLKHQHDVMNLLEEHIRRSTKINNKADYVHDGLQLNYEEMDSLLKSKSTQSCDKE
ncbi:coiled-coil domain-containing protein 175 isoform X1 [Pogona vitticeps]